VVQRALAVWPRQPAELSRSSLIIIIVIITTTTIIVVIIVDVIIIVIISIVVIIDAMRCTGRLTAAAGAATAAP
jgi:hypothetical protein